MKLKTFQKQDLARAALHDGLILSWDTGLGKTWALFLWALLKLGHTREAIGLLNCLQARAGHREQSPNAIRIRPKAPVLIVAPGDLHQQIIDEAWERFGIVVVALDSQETFHHLCRHPVTGRTLCDERGRPIIPAEFYITSYTQLTTNGVQRIPDVQDWPDIVALRQLLCLQNGEHVGLDTVENFCQQQSRRVEWDQHPDLHTTCEFFAWRGLKWRNDYATFGLDPRTATQSTLRESFDRLLAELAERRDQEQAEKERVALQDRFDVLKMLVNDQPDPRFADLDIPQQDFVTREFLADFLLRASVGDGDSRTYEKFSDGTWHKPGSKDAVANSQREAIRGAVEVNGIIIPDAEDGDGSKAEAKDVDNLPPVCVAKWAIKCVYSASLSDYSHDAFRCVVVDEGVKLKGANTYVGLGVRQMNPEYRLVLTATPVKNRVPDLFWLAHWATGGKPEAHARFPFRGEVAAQTEFAEDFMVAEHNLTREEADAEEGKKASSGRYKKLTAEVCNIHRLWKFLGPIVLRRRKDDCHEDIVPKIRHVIRCKMGTQQADVYNYHLQCCYEDIHGEDAIGARLQALRMAAADPSSLHLKEQPGDPAKPCRCTQKPVPPDVQLARLKKEREALETAFHSRTYDAVRDKRKILEHCNDLARIDEETAKPVQRYDKIAAKQDCAICHGKGELPLPPRSGQPFIPKHASVLNLVHEILGRHEQVVIGSAFNDPLDRLSEWLTEAGVRHLKLDGRTSQKKRGLAAAQFKRGRVVRLSDPPGPQDAAIPVLLAGVECMAEGHSFDLANNVILLAYSWALDKFIQFLNRVHRMTSRKPVNIYVVICDGTIDRKLESLVQEKGDSSDLVLDGRLMGERSEEINLAELLQVAQREFDPASDTLDEALLHAQWPALRDQLHAAMTAWDATCEQVPVTAPTRATVPKPRRFLVPANPAPAARLRYDPATGRYFRVVEKVTVVPSLPPPPVLRPREGEKVAESRTNGIRENPTSAESLSALRPKSKRSMVIAMVDTNDPWALL